MDTFDKEKTSLLAFPTEPLNSPKQKTTANGEEEGKVSYRLTTYRRQPSKKTKTKTKAIRRHKFPGPYIPLVVGPGAGRTRSCDLT